jgi:hypothetical protein
MPTQDDNTEGVWRDEERLPLADLVQAVARSAEDGQDDADLAGGAGTRPHSDGDPDPDSEEGRALRTDFTGPTGPN